MTTANPSNAGVDYARDYATRVPFAEHLGFRIDHLEDGLARLSCELRPEMTNSWGMAHGGVIATLLDVTLCMAARTQHPGSKGIMTIDMSISFIGPGTSPLRAEGRVMKPGKNTIFAEAEVRNGEGALVAKAIGTLRARYPEK